MFRFTIRDVLWLMVAAALALGWWRDHQDNLRLKERLVRADMELAKELGMAKLRAISAETALKNMRDKGSDSN